ncbi:CsgG/HfaB family protein [Vibrio aestuarianus]|uniref:Penicillin-binding protein activator LpoB n=2 Tax=Vibrio aestuarianus TaxID=28171 RepID=A0ABM9FQN6_9VIBR|nr:CsgG/HfaB family protein [Vibrio aestuarianus]MDE1214637.1 penicillin-binding protein activator LpoB [Vibrio aestuarianus]MDE1217050.1 penicillin-binding protein activator LpoB [Vibrio aestuarianus]MDE1228233.1 penicillin-binding protein activator LpoB [Vibrio aestuarianus]MDE1231754.1 penicillin-binding protein activator LpoB [Vibrio aestuarianus]MDE1239053.1 penicillin-binding protein activator LpoB [Vibrio aestuarianus]
MKLRTSLLIVAPLALSACAPVQYSGKQTSYDSVNQPSELVQGTGVESQDIVAMTDQMARDMLSNPVLAGRATPPRVIVDSEYFKNESSSRINKNLITDRLRINLNRAAAGRMFFINRENLDMLQAERKMKRDGTTDKGTTGMSKTLAGVDYRLVGRIASRDAVDTNSGAQSSYNQITFEMIDLEQGYTVWSGLYEFKKSTMDDVIYR